MNREAESVDAIVVGANTRGLVTTYVLSSLGFRAVLLDAGQRVGGADASFVTPGGNRFEFGMHVLDYMRSRVATRLFARVVDQQVHRVTLARAIVLRNHVLPYAPKASDLPADLRAMLPSTDLHDDIGDELPTRERLSRCYGSAFTDLIYDEVLPSFPCEVRHREFGVDEARLLTNVYPWFFPRAARESSRDESRAFHDRLREGIEQQILYPREGGFGGFAAGFLRSFDDERIEVLTGVEDLHVEIEPGTHTVSSIRAGGRRFRAPHYFWAAGWPSLCKELSIPCQDIASDRLVLGSLRLSRPAETPYHEILVGDPTHPINRIYFPARFRESEDPLMQIEFAFPKVEDRSLAPDTWLEAWLESTRRLGLVDADHSVEEYDFKTLTMHYNGYGMEGEALRDADPSKIQAGSNIHPVVPSMANLNLNAHVPRTVDFVTKIVSEIGDGDGEALA